MYYNKKVLSEIIGSEAVYLIDSLLETRLILKTGMKDGQKVEVNGQIIVLVCKNKAVEIGAAIVNYIESQNQDDPSVSNYEDESDEFQG